ncbi:MAG: hypothetical protein AAGK14_01590 [Verrucomicrobiota bacterium]
MSTWTLTDAAATERSFADWGLADLRRTLRNLGADVVTFTAPGRAVEADPLFAHGTTVVIKRDGERWFEGRVVRIPVAGSPEAEEQTYQVAGPWWYLDDLVYQQDWNQLSDFGNSLSPLERVRRSRSILGMSADGERISSRLQIQDAVKYAIGQGRPLQLGTVQPTADVPWDEYQDATCAEVIRKMLRWTPDAVTWFDYTTSPPTLEVRHLDSLTARTLDLAASPARIEDLRIVPREDLRRSAVELIYERTDTVDGNDFARVFRDIHPPGANPQGVGALTMTLELGGGSKTYQRQQVKVDPIVEDGVNWWKGKLPWLRDVANLVISNGAVDDEDLPNELIEGSVSSWMDEEAGPVEVTAEASYEVLADPGQPFDETDNPVIDKRSRVKLSTRVRGTTAATRLYARLRSFTPAEVQPVGLAEDLYNALNPLQHEGRLVLVEAEAGAFSWLGSRLQLTGGRAEWASMRAMVQLVREDVAAGRTEISFGPVSPLGADDLLELVRANRGRRPTFRLSERKDGRPGGGAETDGPDATAGDSPDLSGGAPAQFTVLDTEGSGRVVLDSEDCDDRELRVREVDVCDNGEAKKMLIVASEPYTPS